MRSPPSTPTNQAHHPPTPTHPPHPPPHLEVLDDAREHVRDAGFVRERDGRLDHGAVVAAVERHAALPKGLEKVGQHLGAHVPGLDAVGADALLDDLVGVCGVCVGGGGVGALGARVGG